MHVKTSTPDTTSSARSAADRSSRAGSGGRGPAIQDQRPAAAQLMSLSRVANQPRRSNAVAQLKAGPEHRPASAGIVQCVSAADLPALRAYFDRRVMEIGSPTSARSRAVFQEANAEPTLAGAKVVVDRYVSVRQAGLDHAAAEPAAAGPAAAAHGAIMPRAIASAPVGRQKLPTGNDLYNHLVTLVMANHHDRPYATDFFHEKKPMMQAIMTNAGMMARLRFFMSALAEMHHVVLGYDVGARPEIQVIGIEIIINPQLAGQYQHAMQVMNAARGGRGPSPQSLAASGHGAAMTDTITRTGFRPDLGQYHGMKGHGALGRGAYFTDRVDKAISYSGNEPGERGTFLLSQVLTGDMHRVRSGTPLRHETHNEMVRAGRASLNLPRVEGTSNVDLSAYDSILGEGHHPSGGSAIRAGLRSRAGEFDSNELLIRNADQILPRFVIHYEVRPTPRASGTRVALTVTATAPATTAQ